MQTKVKIDIRQPLVNGIISTFLHVQIVAIIFVILLVLCYCFLLRNLHICKYVRETQVKHIRGLQFFKWVAGLQN